MKKNCKWLAALIAVGTVIGLMIAYFCKKKNETSEFDDDLESDDDLELDGDLKSVSEREYVPLNKATDQSATKAGSESEETEEGSEADTDGPTEAEDEVKETSEHVEEEAASDKE